MAEMLTYEQHLTPATGARGSYHMEVSHYEEVPSAAAGKNHCREQGRRAGAARRSRIDPSGQGEGQSDQVREAASLCHFPKGRTSRHVSSQVRIAVHCVRAQRVRSQGGSNVTLAVDFPSSSWPPSSADARRFLRHDLRLSSSAV